MERNEIFDVNKITQVELLYKNPVKPSCRPKIKTSKDAYEMFMKCWDLGKIELQEQFKVMLLNTANKVLGIFLLSSGGVQGTVADRKLLFATALKSNASKVILCHNHPSGLTNPSTADLRITQEMVAAGRILDIRVDDHLIITQDGYYSFVDNGVM